ncbi:T9SS type B sorting domain-containing protein [Eudoraea chungangensis]|uniref:T9SS type B sorting domain-containing protein n=1 Tax=Eudoraea chungangensis TaxID=1481905 RepID=UPI0023EBA2B5|nr:T9SS type B sorting domain-containing protein [Eudoraea chungangensis]
MMKKKIIFGLMLWIGHFAMSQECPRLITPSDGASGVPVDVTITWPPVPGIIGYLVSLGTTPGGGEILNRRSAGLTNSYTPEVGLPENTTIYVTISLFLFDQPLRICPSESFTTADVTTPPVCTFLNSPLNNETNVDVTSPLQWSYASLATNYRISAGTSPGATDILDDFTTGNVLSYNPPGDLPQDSPIYVRITPFNENGDASGCIEESFSTGNAVIDCNAFFDPDTGTIVPRRPKSDVPTTLGLCGGQNTTDYTTRDVADGYRWFKINEDGSESLISSTATVNLTELGPHRYEAYNIITEGSFSYECPTSINFEVVPSEIAVIESLNIERLADGKRIEVIVSGLGAYEYALDQRKGPYQNSNVFTQVSEGLHTVYVRDKFGCGIAERVVERELSADDFPRFFTPNGDGINDFWQFIAPEDNQEIKVLFVQIFDRYGTLLTQILPNTRGWDGTFNGQPLPASSYWFKAKDNLNNEVKGYFALKR